VNIFFKASKIHSGPGIENNIRVCVRQYGHQHKQQSTACQHQLYFILLFNHFQHLTPFERSVEKRPTDKAKMTGSVNDIASSKPHR
jgi:hypothetical protein